MYISLARTLTMLYDDFQFNSWAGRQAGYSSQLHSKCRHSVVACVNYVVGGLPFLWIHSVFYYGISSLNY